MKNISRRDFIKAVGALGISAAVGGALPLLAADGPLSLDPALLRAPPTIPEGITLLSFSIWLPVKSYWVGEGKPILIGEPIPVRDHRLERVEFRLPDGQLLFSDRYDSSLYYCYFSVGVHGPFSVEMSDEEARWTAVCQQGRDILFVDTGGVVGRKLISLDRAYCKRGDTVV